jgi:DNA-directed RNA polymerase subunit RPC12/RpoP
MAKVVGRDESAVKYITCRQCAARVEYTPGEVRNLYSGTDYGGGPDGADGFNCPACGKQIHVRRW